MSRKSYYICHSCGRLIPDGDGSLNCCDKMMTQIFEGTRGEGDNKHIPLVSVKGDKVTVNVGKEGHPMTPEHLIEWVYLKTDKGRYIKYLDATEAPSVTFPIKNEVPLEVSAYCNKHGLWRAEM